VSLSVLHFSVLCCWAGRMAYRSVWCSWSSSQCQHRGRRCQSLQAVVMILSASMTFTTFVIHLTCSLLASRSRFVIV